MSKEEVLQSQPPALKPSSNPKIGEMIQHGKYLVEAVALCGDCHTPKDSQNRPIMDKWLQGATLAWVNQLSYKDWSSHAVSLVGLPEGWKEADMVQYLETGMLPNGGYTKPPMPPYRMSHKDALAITLYLESLKDGNNSETDKKESATKSGEESSTLFDK
ncbi:cytochrome C [Methylacidiphilum caldifontis]|nr:cytochrome C [Methylacidiphilum caldifontis]